MCLLVYATRSSDGSAYLCRHEQHIGIDIVTSVLSSIARQCAARAAGVASRLHESFCHDRLMMHHHPRGECAASLVVGGFLSLAATSSSCSQHTSPRVNGSMRDGHCRSSASTSSRLLLLFERSQLTRPALPLRLCNLWPRRVFLSARLVPRLRQLERALLAPTAGALRVRESPSVRREQFSSDASFR